MFKRLSSLISLIIFFGILTLLLSLSYWQFSRAHQKQVLIETYKKSYHTKKLHFDDIKNKKPIASLRYQPIQLQGHYDNRLTLLLDNQFYQHQVGFHILTPFWPKGAKKAILVNRGWIKAGIARSQPIAIPKLSSTSQTIKGRIYVTPGHALRLGPLLDSSSPSKKTIIIEALDFPAIAHHIHTPLFPFTLRLHTPKSNHLIQDWKPTLHMTPARHRSYAYQWLSLSLVWVIGFLKLHRSKSTGYTKGISKDLLK